MSDDDVVLVVEDDADTRTTLCRLLELEGRRAIGAANGLEALERLDRERQSLPCLVLLDLIMPRMDGWELFDRLKADPDLARLPVVVVTAVRSGSRAVPAADAVLAKPIDVDALLEIVGRHC